MQFFGTMALCCMFSAQVFNFVLADIYIKCLLLNYSPTIHNSVLKTILWTIGSSVPFNSICIILFRCKKMLHLLINSIVTMVFHKAETLIRVYSSSDLEVDRMLLFFILLFLSYVFCHVFIYNWHSKIIVWVVSFAQAQGYSPV